MPCCPNKCQSSQKQPMQGWCTKTKATQETASKHVTVVHRKCSQIRPYRYERGSVRAEQMLPGLGRSSRAFIGETPRSFAGFFSCERARERLIRPPAGELYGPSRE